MVTIEQAVRIVLDTAARHGVVMPAEPASLDRAAGRVLRQSVVSDADSPRFDKSIRDGFAVRVSDTVKVPVDLKITAEVKAGDPAGARVEPGACVEVMTGALLPQGADAVVMVEHTEPAGDGQVRILRAPKAGQGLLRQGAECRSGDILLDAGRTISVADIGLMAGAGCAAPLVAVPPRVAVLATGDELVDPGEVPAVGQIRNSNSFTLSAQVREAGGVPVMLGVARDDPGSLRGLIRSGLESNLLLISGGVSMGKYDFVEPVLAEFDVRVLFDSVAMKPGKPTVFAHTGDRFIVGLPGNPLSTIVAFHMFVRPLIRHLLGCLDAGPRVLTALMDGTLKCDPERAGLLPARTYADAETQRIRPVAWKGSSDLVSLSQANALIVVPQRDGQIEHGQPAEYISLGEGR